MGGRTSQFSKIKQRPPATDLSGGKASAESLTPRRSSLAEAGAVDLQPDFFLSVATLGSGCGSEPDAGPALSPCPVFSALRLLPVSRYLTSFFSLENDSRRSSMSVSGKRRWWLR